MWEYQRTDELYHNIMTRNKQSELYHSDVYLGEDFSDGIRHWKYLKKVKSPSGKWRYIYDESELNNARNEIDTIKKSVSDKNGWINYKDSAGQSVSVKDNVRITTGTYNGNTKQSASDKIKENAVKTINQKEKDFSKQKISDIPKRIISRGIGFINSLLLNIEKKWIR